MIYTGIWRLCSFVHKKCMGPVFFILGPLLWIKNKHPLGVLSKLIIAMAYLSAFSGSCLGLDLAQDAIESLESSPTAISMTRASEKVEGSINHSLDKIGSAIEAADAYEVTLSPILEYIFFLLCFLLVLWPEYFLQFQQNFLNNKKTTPRFNDLILALAFLALTYILTRIFLTLPLLRLTSFHMIVISSIFVCIRFLYDMGYGRGEIWDKISLKISFFLAITILLIQFLMATFVLWAPDLVPLPQSVPFAALVVQKSIFIFSLMCFGLYIIWVEQISANRYGHIFLRVITTVLTILCFCLLEMHLFGRPAPHLETKVYGLCAILFGLCLLPLLKSIAELIDQKIMGKKNTASTGFVYFHMSLLCTIVAMLIVIFLIFLFDPLLYGHLKQTGTSLAGRATAILVTVVCTYYLSKVLSIWLDILAAKRINDYTRKGASPFFTVVEIVKIFIPFILWFLSAVLIMVLLEVDSKVIFLTIALVLGGAFLLGRAYVNDILAGISWILKDALAIGDQVTIKNSYFGKVEGRVERLALDGVSVRDINGTMHTVKYSAIYALSSDVDMYAYALINLSVAENTDLDLAMKLMKDLGDQMHREQPETVLDNFEIHGVQSLSGTSITLQGRIKVAPAKQHQVARDYNLRIKKILDAHTIKLT